MLCRTRGGSRVIFVECRNATGVVCPSPDSTFGAPESHIWSPLIRPDPISEEDRDAARRIGPGAAADNLVLALLRTQLTLRFVQPAHASERRCIVVSCCG